MAAIDLPSPTIADFDFTVSRGGAVTDHEMVGQAVAHPADVAVVVIEDARVTLPRAAVVNDDELPALPQHWGAIDFRAHRSTQKLVALPKKMKGEKRKTTRLLVAGF